MIALLIAFTLKRSTINLTFERTAFFSNIMWRLTDRLESIGQKPHLPGRWISHWLNGSLSTKCPLTPPRRAQWICPTLTDR